MSELYRSENSTGTLESTTVDNKTDNSRQQKRQRQTTEATTVDNKSDNSPENLAVDTDIIDFLRTRARASPKFAAVEDDIFALLTAGASYGQVVVFLDGKGIAADRAEIYRYVHRRARRLRLTADKTGTGQPPDNSHGAAASHPTTGPRTSPTAQPAQAGQGKATGTDPALPQFNWTAVRNDCKLEW